MRMNSMHKVLFFNGQSKVIADIFFEKAPEGFNGSWKPYQMSLEEKADLIRDVEFLVLHPAEISGSLMREAKSLRLIQLLAAGYDKVDLDTATELGIPVATNGGANAWGVAEQSIALLLALYRRLIQCDRSIREGRWRKAISGFDTFEVAGKTVGLIGLGNIGRKVAKRFKAFETRILYHDIVPAPDIERELGALNVSLDEVLRESDIISIHLPLLQSTRNLIGERELSLMKPTSVFLNTTSRGEIVDEGALCAALRAKRIAGAGLDVYHQEPISQDNPLLDRKSVV